MKDIMGMMKAAQEMQGRMQEFQAKLSDSTVEGRSGAGMVTVTLTLKGDMKRLRIDPSLFSEDSVEVLEDLILAAHNDARGKAETEMNARMQEMTAGLPLPPGMKFPF
ncbi:YbaB/EbfC family nucleoid-associated protein [Devosia sp.]|uniref:YbaB/EbfC family nucleoid-associated protein n=1 Tax=Devosia sp. TaxID=1871048 RepID=UPI0035AEAFF4